MGERAEKAKALFMEGYNCSQSVIGAFADLYGMEPVEAMRFAEGLGGGLGRLRLTCGAVASMALVAGLKMSSGKPGDLENRARVYEKVREMTAEFEAKNGTIVCRELLGAALPKDDGAVPEARTADFYKKRPCARYIFEAAEIVERALLAEDESES